MSPRVKEVKPLENYLLLVNFTNDEQGIFDIKPYLEDKFWSKLKNIHLFNTVHVAGGSVEWLNGEIDFCPDEVYENSIKNKEIIEKTIGASAEEICK